MLPSVVKRLVKVSANLGALGYYRKLVEDTGTLASQLEDGQSSLMESMNKRDIMGATRDLRNLKKLTVDIKRLALDNEHILRGLGDGQ